MHRGTREWKRRREAPTRSKPRPDLRGGPRRCYRSRSSLHFTAIAALAPRFPLGRTSHASSRREAPVAVLLVLRPRGFDRWLASGPDRFLVRRSEGARVGPPARRGPKNASVSLFRGS